jgi:Uma2 family endonuclease
MSVMPESTSTKLTYEDFLLLPDDGRRHEIIDGEHFVSPSPVTKHQAIVMRLSSALHSFLRKNPIGKVFPAPLDVVLSDTDIVEPDILYVSNDRSHIITEKNIQGAPDLVIEILSDATRKTDEIIKRKLYERFGVGEYWLIDPLLETVKVFRRSEGVFVRAEELSTETGGALTTPLIPGLRVELSDLFETE